MKKRIVRQVGYLQTLYRNARSREHKILPKMFVLMKQNNDDDDDDDDDNNNNNNWTKTLV